MNVTKTRAAGPASHNAYADLDVDADQCQRLRLVPCKQDYAGARGSRTSGSILTEATGTDSPHAVGNMDV